MQGYLATIGRDKVGFSIVGSRADGQPVYVHGTRGVIERNTMRYYVAIEAYLGTMALPPPPHSSSNAAWRPGLPASNAIRRSCMNSNAASTSR